MKRQIEVWVVTKHWHKSDLIVDDNVTLDCCFNRDEALALVQSFGEDALSEAWEKTRPCIGAIDGVFIRGCGNHREVYAKWHIKPDTDPIFLTPDQLECRLCDIDYVRVVKELTGDMPVPVDSASGFIVIRTKDAAR